MNLLFVCLGNICRSPAAEAAMISILVKEGLEGKITVDSAGTSAYHAGEKADRRMREHGQKRGLNLASRSRQFISEDFENFDLIIVMDNSNYNNVMSLDINNKYGDKVVKMTDYCSEHVEKEVPDPYYDGETGFEKVLDMVENGCENLLKQMRSKVDLV
jgi:protein-tyrosine phosphatase